MLAKLIARVIVRLNEYAPKLSPNESAFLNQTCVKCGSEFDVPADFVFDRRRAYYCDDCI